MHLLNITCTYCSYSTIITCKCLWKRAKHSFLLCSIPLSCLVMNKICLNQTKCLWTNQTSLRFAIDKYRSNYSTSFTFAITFIVKLISIVYNCLWLIRLHIAAWGQSAHFCTVESISNALTLWGFTNMRTWYKTSIAVLQPEPFALPSSQLQGQ